jgi:hypothetical protein
MGQTVKCVAVFRRRPDLTLEEFTAYWLENHSALIRSLSPTMKSQRYVQSHLLRGELTDLLNGSRNGIEPFDGVAEVWFDIEDLEGEMTHEQLLANIEVLEDERKFIDLERSTFFFTIEHQFLPEPV